MPYRADPICPVCNQFNVVYVDQNQMPPTDEQFAYRCGCGQLIVESLRVYEEVQEIPPDKQIAVHA